MKTFDLTSQYRMYVSTDMLKQVRKGGLFKLIMLDSKLKPYTTGAFKKVGEHTCEVKV